MSIRMIVHLVIVCILIGCSNPEVNKLSKISNERDRITSDTTDEKPPGLILTIGGDVIKTYRGTYSWHYQDKTTGQDVVIHADHAGPTQMVNIEEGVKANLSKPVNLRFAKEPISYEINLWNSDELVATYKSFEEIKEQGNYIVEIVGLWGESTATYVVALNITNQ